MKRLTIIVWSALLVGGCVPTKPPVIAPVPPPVVVPVDPDRCDTTQATPLAVSQCHVLRAIENAKLVLSNLESYAQSKGVDLPALKADLTSNLEPAHGQIDQVRDASNTNELHDACVRVLASFQPVLDALAGPAFGTYHDALMARLQSVRDAAK